ncbi:MAG: hypothetical protein Tsb0020_14870 [Haliangiales bacterium]
MTADSVGGSQSEVEGMLDGALKSGSLLPRRYVLARELDRRHAFTSLFDEPSEPIQLGNFTLLRFVGGGGMGEVYEAHDERLDRTIAIKLVRSDRSTSERDDDRLLREAQTLARLSHPNVVQIHEAGWFEGRVFIAMEFIRGSSLRAWLQQRAESGQPPPLREVLALLLEVGRGLQAAHEVGLVHRDFKPDNILVGTDGRSRVVDFGLARSTQRVASPPGALAEGEHEIDVATAATLLPDGPTDAGAMDTMSQRPLRLADRVLTTCGKFLGTPRYMAPEQRRGEAVDARCDQYSFCVTLYEAICGAALPSGEALSDPLRAVHKRGGLRDSRGRRVPAAVQKVLRRGLAPRPEDRFSDMGALLDALAAWPRRRRLAVAVAAALVAGTVLVYGAAGETRDQMCDDADERVVAEWTPQRRVVIREAFARTGLKYAEVTWEALERDLDQYAARLASELVAVCEATYERQTQSLATFESRLMCLSARRQRLTALLAQLEQADVSAVERAHKAALDLPELTSCTHTETLRYGMPTPAPAIADEVERVRQALAEARTEELLGHMEEATQLARKLVSDSERLGYAPVRAEALYQQGRILAHEGTTRADAERGEKLLLQAQMLAESSRHDELSAELWSQLLFSASRNHSDTRQARAWYERAVAAIERIGRPARREIAVLRNLARVHYQEGEYEAARDVQREALALSESRPEVPPLVRGLCLHDLAATQRRLGALAASQRHYEQALVIHEAQFGASHPSLLDLRFGIAMLLVQRGEPAAARAHLIELASIGDGHSDVHARALIELSDIERQSGALASASRYLDKALALLCRLYGCDHVEYARGLLRLGAIAYQRGEYDDARAAYERARAIFVRDFGPEHIDVGFVLANLLEVELAEGRSAEAQTAYTQAERILARHFDSTPALAPYLASMHGQILLGEERYEPAADVLERALPGLAALEGVVRADTYWALAQALAATDTDVERARDMACKALAIYEAQGPEAHTRAPEVRSWGHARMRCH